MRAVVVVSLLVLLCPVAAVAQSASAPSAATGKGGGIAREQYIEQATQRAKQRAAARFDRLDTNHDGVLTSVERRAARTARAKKREAPPQ
jgi:hypothetical protein